MSRLRDAIRSGKMVSAWGDGPDDDIIAGRAPRYDHTDQHDVLAEDDDIDPVLTNEPESVKRRRAQEAATLKAALKAQEREQKLAAEKAAIEHERKEKETVEMESCELWGAF